MLFSDFKLNEKVEMGLKDVGFEKPTPIQSDCIPQIMQGHDLLASAQTGTGKTAAFVLPILNHIAANKKNGIQALILTPTRELAMQVDEQFWSLGYHTGVTTVTVYGGSGDWSRQEKALKNGVNVVVATPGRLLDHIKTNKIDFSNLDFLVLDEADRMLDMGFIPDVTRIIKEMPAKRQTLLFSATLPPKIDSLSSSIMKDPKRINVSTHQPAEGINQVAYFVEEKDKISLLLNLFEKMEWSSAIIFTGTKRLADTLSRQLAKKGAQVTSIHGDRDQKDREAALADFKRGKFKVIVATDVMSRGIDIDNVSHVINFSVPRDVEDYVHRIGRTARAESTGDAITLVSREDKLYMKSIFKSMDQFIKVIDLPDEIGNGQNSDKPQEKNQSGSERSSGRRKPKDASRARQKTARKTNGQARNGSAKPERRRQKEKTGESRPAGPVKRSQAQQARRSQTAGKKTGPASRSGSSKSLSRRKLLENVKSPNTEKLDKTLNSNSDQGFWGKIKSLFG